MRCLVRGPSSSCKSGSAVSVRPSCNTMWRCVHECSNGRSAAHCSFDDISTVTNTAVHCSSCACSASGENMWTGPATYSAFANARAKILIGKSLKSYTSAETVTLRVRKNGVSSRDAVHLALMTLSSSMTTVAYNGPVAAARNVLQTVQSSATQA
ncbi:hypothetical protein AURDEDRAFT_110244 [Auricularia subglabra TFB-10046 SS5]|nr:hypothetical protein AURDEDRAFT_110244 [Auricularia subglabra TFB-10046 SS5]